MPNQENKVPEPIDLREVNIQPPVFLAGKINEIISYLSSMKEEKVEKPQSDKGKEITICPIHDNTHFCKYKVGGAKCECKCTCVPKEEDLAREVHGWYLESCKELDPESYNAKAQKSYDELTEGQKFLDRYMAKKILEMVSKTKEEQVNRIKKNMEIAEIIKPTDRSGLLVWIKDETLEKGDVALINVKVLSALDE